MQVAIGKGDEYCGGEVVFLDNIDGDKLSWIELEERERAGNASENEESDEEDDTEFIDSDYKQDTDAEEVEVDDTMFEECIDNPIEEEPEEMGYAREISDDVQNSEDLHSKQNNDDECDENGEVTSNRKKRNVPNFRQLRRETMLKNPTFDIGMHFANKTIFKEAVCTNTVQHYTCMVGKNIWFKKDDKQRVRDACEVGCPFVIFASRIDDSPTLVIKTLNLEHECSMDQRNYWLNSTFFAQRYSNGQFLDLQLQFREILAWSREAQFCLKLRWRVIKEGFIGCIFVWKHARLDFCKVVGL
ncbi:unnamed protein product [Prunus brigantina]